MRMLSRRNCPTDPDSGLCAECRLSPDRMAAGECRDAVSGNLTRFAYASIDVETTGLDPTTHDIIQFGMVLDDWHTPIEQLPTLSILVANESGQYNVSPYCVFTHAELFKQLSKPDELEVRWCYQHELAEIVGNFLNENGYRAEKLFCAGKNFAGFDRQFLEALDGWTEMIPMHHRTLDPLPYFYNPRVDFENPPDLQTCLDRAGIKRKVEHTALQDALDVVELLRYAYGI